MTPTKLSIIVIVESQWADIAGCLDAIMRIDCGEYMREIIVVDNASNAAQLGDTLSAVTGCTLLRMQTRNRARAANEAIAIASGEAIAVTGCDAPLAQNWLHESLAELRDEPGTGAICSGLTVPHHPADGKETDLHSLMQELATAVAAQNNALADFIAAASMPRMPPDAEPYRAGAWVFLKQCLEDVGAWDENLLASLEDIDYLIRLCHSSWRVSMSAGPCDTREISDQRNTAEVRYMLARNTLYLRAKFLPASLGDAIRQSEFATSGEFDNLYRSTLLAARTACEQHDTDVARSVLRDLQTPLAELLSPLGARHFFSQLQLQLGLRKIRVGIYDHAGHFAGGGQRYIAELAALLQSRYDVTFIFNKPVELAKYRDWYDLDLSQCAARVVPIALFDDMNLYTPDETLALAVRSNVFDGVAAESANYDLFINANMLGKVNPLALQSIFICHFPDKERDRLFQVHKYDQLVISGKYGGSWVKKRWGLQPTFTLYPPVNMYSEQSSPSRKDNIILSVSRFEISGSKKQLEMARAFIKLCRLYPVETRDWTLVLAGGSTPGNPYLERVQTEVAATECNIEIKANCAFSEIRDFYRRARIFWHSCGLDETKPERVEHFGMTTVEAMQNYCVPIVIDGGGQREIVQDGISGFRFSNIDELCKLTVRVITDSELCERVARAAYDRSHLYDHEVFASAVETLIEQTEAALTGVEEMLPAVSPG